MRRCRGAFEAFRSGLPCLGSRGCGAPRTLTPTGLGSHTLASLFLNLARQGSSLLFGQIFCCTCTVTGFTLKNAASRKDSKRSAYTYIHIHT